MYSRSDLGKADQGCTGCVWRADEQGDTGVEVAVVPGESPTGGVAGLRGVEGQASSEDRVRRFRDASKAIEAKRRFEETWPQAVIYQPTEEK